MKRTDILQPYAIHLAGIFSAINGLNDKHLEELLGACKGSTQTNCWWATYRAAQLMQPEIESEIRRRHGNAKKTLQTFAALTAKPGAVGVS